MDIMLRGVTIAKDENGYVNLNDLWKLSGEPHTKAPRFWRQLPTTKELVQAFIVRKSYNSDVIYAKRGNVGGTFAHIILALAYAEYLNPELGVEVREIALRVYAGDVSVLDAYRRDRQAQLEDDHNRVTARNEIKRNNFDLNQLLKEIGAKRRNQYAAFHDHGYMGLYGGMRENDIHSHKKLTHGEKILDHMGFQELSANMFRTATTQDYLTQYPADGVMRAAEIHKRFGQKVRAFLEENGLTMPEDHPTPDSIKDAERRLKNHEKLLK